jgi:predicted lipoprotein
MLKSLLKYASLIILLILVVYNSVYFRKLDAVRSSSSSFDAPAYARNYFDHKLGPALDKAIDIRQLVALLSSDKEQAFKQYAHALGIGNIKYFLVKGQGAVTAIDENGVALSIAPDTANLSLQIATEYIFGNALRDAAGIIDINEFSNTLDINNVSSEINKIVRKELLPGFKQIVKQGDTVLFAGAVELNKAHLDLLHIEVIPARLEIKK